MTSAHCSGVAGSVNGAVVVCVAVMLRYGSGVSLEECLDLRVKDLDFDRHQIHRATGKGPQRPCDVLPAAAREALTEPLARVRRIHDADLARGLGRVVLPFAMASVARVDVLASWNFRHVVNLRRIHGYHDVNRRLGYPALEIRSPREVLGDE